MNCVVTAGPTFEPVDEVRRLTNISTGQLGSDLADHLTGHGHTVTLLLGHYAIHRLGSRLPPAKVFTTAADLGNQLQALAGSEVQAVFHAAAVCDFTFGDLWECTDSQHFARVKESKLSTGREGLLAELRPTPKLIASLRDWFPAARLVGWKYELDGDRSSVVDKARRQITENRTDACVANGRAYGEGFGLLTASGKHAHYPDRSTFFAALEEFCLG